MILIRTEAGSYFGRGHLTRAINFLKRFQIKDGEIPVFVTSPYSDSDLFSSQSLNHIALPASCCDWDPRNYFVPSRCNFRISESEQIQKIISDHPDSVNTILIVDCYNISDLWLRSMRPLFSRIICIADSPPFSAYPDHWILPGIVATNCLDVCKSGADLSIGVESLLCNMPTSYEGMYPESASGGRGISEILMYFGAIPFDVYSSFCRDFAVFCQENFSRIKIELFVSELSDSEAAVLEDYGISISLPESNWMDDRSINTLVIAGGGNAVWEALVRGLFVLPCQFADNQRTVIDFVTASDDYHWVKFSNAEYLVMRGEKLAQSIDLDFIFKADQFQRGLIGRAVFSTEGMIFRVNNLSDLTVLESDYAEFKRSGSFERVLEYRSINLLESLKIELHRAPVNLDEREVVGLILSANFCVGYAVWKMVGDQRIYSRVSAIKFDLAGTLLTAEHIFSFLKLGDKNTIFSNKDSFYKSPMVWFLSDSSSFMWVNRINFIPRMAQLGVPFTWVTSLNDLMAMREFRKGYAGELILVLFACFTKVPREIRDLFTDVWIVHESDLPSGKGWSPLTYQLKAGESEIVFTLLRAEEAIDSGQVITKKTFSFPEHLIFEEIKCSQGIYSLGLVKDALSTLGLVSPKPQGDLKEGQVAYYPRLAPNDSELDPSGKLFELFNAIRVCDPSNYPAFFRYKGSKYTITLRRIDE